VPSNAEQAAQGAYEEEHQETKWRSASRRAKAATVLSRKMLLTRFSGRAGRSA
jgi:hypothetical protein